MTSGPRPYRYSATPPQNVCVLPLCLPQHIEERKRAVPKSRAGTQYVVRNRRVEIRTVFFSDLCVVFQSGFEADNRRRHLGMHDHASLPEALADGAEKVSGQVAQHHNVRCCRRLKCNQHGCPP